MRWLVMVLSAVFVLVLGDLPSQADRRVALVIGNADYPGSRLANPLNDANDVARRLTELGFEVHLVTNAKLEDFDGAIDRFRAAASGADAALIYYAGHSFQFEEQNWLMPVDTQIDTAARARRSNVSLQPMINDIGGRARVTLVFLDACRNNPLAERLFDAQKASGRAYTADRGLSRVEISTPETLVVYATRPNTVASDGEARNSPFTTAFLEALSTPDIEIEAMMKRVTAAVEKTTKGKQTPERLSGLKQEFYFRVEVKVQVPAAPVSGISGEAAQAWAAVKDTASVAVLEDFVRRFGDTIYGTLAQDKLIQLKTPPSRPEPSPAPPQSQPQPAAATPAPAKDTPVAVVAPPAPVVPAAAAPCRAETVAVSGTSRPPGPLSAAEECGLAPKATFSECDTCPEMVVVPAGSFLMGSPEKEPKRQSYEGPQHSVTFAKPFAVGRFAVTFAEWDACVADGGCNGYAPDDNEWGRGRQPVINVSWHEAKTYVAWLSKKTGKPYRLLTEAEREYVTRAGTTTPFWWGKSISPEQANYDSKTAYGGGRKGKARDRTAAVEAFQPNPWGLYQVHGNVWEWVEDCDSSYADTPTDGTAWTASGCKHRWLRGGSWLSNPEDLRAAYRLWGTPNERSFSNGFRIGRSLAR